MDLIKYTQEWVRGEVLQGKIMVAMGLLFLIAVIFILKGDHQILRGTLIPLGLVLLMLLGYGGFQIFGRPAHVTKVDTLYQENPDKAVLQEYNKALKDDKTYSRFKPIWAVLLVVSVILFFVFTGNYLKGLAIGLMILFLSLLTLDTILQDRLKIYLEGLTELNDSIS